jgi:hypothetical protein
VPFPRPEVDIRRPPEDLDDRVDWFERVSTNLVLSEEYALADVRAAVVALRLSLSTHSAEPVPDLSGRDPVPGLRDRARLLAADHAWFGRSMEQLDWFLGIVEREDHGGHRQALGQYGRILAESVQRHRRDEREYLAGLGSRPLAPGAPSKAK